MIGGAFAGLAGAHLTIAYNSTWIEGITQGRGWIAVGLTIFAVWNPLRALIGAYLFGFVDIMQYRLQPFGIAPSILAADFSKLGEEIKRAEECGADLFHIDVMDGHFVPNITIGAPVVRDIRKVTKLVLDSHLMISNPEKYIDDFAKAGSDIITFHIEATKDPKGIIKKIKSYGIKAGISIKPKTGRDVG